MVIFVTYLVLFSPYISIKRLIFCFGHFGLWNKNLNILLSKSNRHKGVTVKYDGEINNGNIKLTKRKCQI